MVFAASNQSVLPMNGLRKPNHNALRTNRGTSNRAAAVCKAPLPLVRLLRLSRMQPLRLRPFFASLRAYLDSFAQRQLLLLRLD